jgi:hypothetical protein
MTIQDIQLIIDIFSEEYRTIAFNNAVKQLDAEAAAEWLNADGIKALAIQNTTNKYNELKGEK